ncbi:heavy metal translocating P-type ATPase [Treponema sp. HNW]|uniref:heavy metal translocating P-type ATPase n=1 Tax=Treponema sp. HNW TaxID=3116654 RepID=UPI003D0FDA73
MKELHKNHHEYHCGHMDEHSHEHCHEHECHKHEHCHVHECHEEAQGCGCGCSHPHSDSSHMIIRIVLTLVSFAAIRVLEYFGPLAFIRDFRLAAALVYAIPYLIIGYDILWIALKNIVRGDFFDENFLMSVATIGAMILGEYIEAAAVMLFYQVGEALQSYAVSRSKKSITALMDIRPDYANIEKDGELIQIDPAALKAGDIIVVKPGEKIPLDGIIIEGESSLNTAALTGESLPRDVYTADAVLSGSVNLRGLLKIRVTKEFGESTVSKILEMVEHAAEKKAKTETFITRFARIYTPIVVFSALLLAVLPPLLFAGDWAMWVRRALIFLVISCPCALVISVPLGFFAGIGCASKHGILIKGGNYLEALAQIKTAVFDKTGTLTRGVFTVTAVHADTINEEQLLELTAVAERYSNHPISLSIKAEYRKRTGKNVESGEFEKRVTNVNEIAGRGISAVVDGKKIYAGNSRFMDEINVKWRNCSKFGTIVHTAVDGFYAGHIVITDEPKPNAAEAVRQLKKAGVEKTVMLTGDSKTAGDYIASQLNVDEVYADLLPAGKVEIVEKLLAPQTSGTAAPGTVSNGTTEQGALAFVGDGINDAPVLALADIGIAMGAMGSDAAIEAADVVLMDDDPAKLPLSMRIARRSIGIIRQNIVFALGIKIAVMVLGAFGIANMWTAVFADTGVALLAVLNSMRALKIRS